MTDCIPRLTFPELPLSIQELLRSKVNRLGYLGEFFAATAHQENALCAFIRFTDECKGALPEKHVELIVLTISTSLGIEYETNQHERLCIRLGFSRDWVEDVERLSPETSQLLDPVEKKLQRFVIDALASNGRNMSTQLDCLAESLGYGNAVAVLMVSGRYICHAFMVNALAIEAPVPSIFDDGFGGDGAGAAKK